MDLSELTTLKSLRTFLVKNGDRVQIRRCGPEKRELRGRLDETMLPFRVARRAAHVEDTESWLRSVRQAIGVPVDVLAQQLGVTKHEVFRLEKAERESRIVLANLRRVATALGCELVYALVPREGSLEDVAAAEKKAREAAHALARREEEKSAAVVNKFIGGPEALRRALRRELRKRGLRVR